MRRAAFFLLAGACAYAAVVIPIAIHKGGDFTAELTQSERLLRGLAPFGAADPSVGVPWPPFSAVVLVPFALIARLSLPLAKALWTVGGVAAVWYTLHWTGRLGWRPALLALGAVAVPLQTNFEHANIAAILLGLVVLALARLDTGDTNRAGAVLGVAAALKAFPALLLAHFALRREWRPLAVGGAVAVALTLLALLPLGATHLVANVRDWLTLGLTHQWTAQPSSDQSLRALVSRVGGPEAIAWGAGLLALVVTLAVLARYRPAPLTTIGALSVVAVLLSPFAWVHAFVLLFPAWLAVLARGAPLTAPGVRVLLAVAWLGTSGLLTVGPRWLRAALLQYSVYTWSAVLLLVVVLQTARAANARPSPASVHAA